jgi:thioredoxin-like negative regulator of GroEL
MKKIHDMKQYHSAVAGAGVNGLHVLYFHMECCMPCGKVEPMLEHIEVAARKQAPAARFLSIDVDEVPALMNQFKVAAAPCIIFTRGKVQEGKRIVGAKPRVELATRIAQALGLREVELISDTEIDAALAHDDDEAVNAADATDGAENGDEDDEEDEDEEDDEGEDDETSQGDVSRP